MRFSSLAVWLSRDRGLAHLRSCLLEMGRPVLLTSLTVAGLVVGLRAVGLFERPGLALYDQFVRLQPDRGPDERLLVVGIDEADLQRLGEWPISDATLAQALEALQGDQPRVIGVDILRDIPIGVGRAELIAQLQRPNVVIVCKVNSASDPGVPPPAELPRESAVFADLAVDPGGTLRRSLLYLNPPPLADSSAPVHACNTPETLVSLSFGTALTYLANEGITPAFAEDSLLLGETPFPSLTPGFGSYQDADVLGYQVMLRYRAEEDSVPVVSFTDVLAGQVAAGQVRDRIVLIGYTTPLAKDDFYTPYSIGRDDQQQMPGVIVHAQATSQLLGAVLDGQPLVRDWPLAMEIAWIGGWTLIAGGVAWSVKRPSRFVLGILILGGAAYGAALLLFVQGVWVPIVPVLASVVLTASGVVLVERFNRGDYGKQFVAQVKTFLHIDIDEEKLDKQVAEITETDYFQDLKTTVETLRTGAADEDAQLSSQPSESQPSESENLEPNPDHRLDALTDLTAEAQQLKPNPDSVCDT